MSVWKNAAIVVLALAVAFLADRLVREENQRDALLVGMCSRPETPLLPINLTCLEATQTRTSWFWHLYYALTDHLPAVPLLPGSFTADEWRGFVYPNKNDLTTDLKIGTYHSLKECRDAALAAGGGSTTADYECGLNCKDELGPSGPLVCERTER
jgi:hypothetical protein